eukprot:GHVN01040104.1.p1 GENE.GHVN01040104.1~~GHVN01040104.1.p1  ORF type:complete len:190 (-),score=43.47 GHVN01040104.1:113-682(-)
MTSTHPPPESATSPSLPSASLPTDTRPPPIFTIEGAPTPLANQLDLDLFLRRHQGDVLCEAPRWYTSLTSATGLINAPTLPSKIAPTLAPLVENPSKMSCTRLYKELDPSQAYVIRSAQASRSSRLSTPLSWAMPFTQMYRRGDDARWSALSFGVGVTAMGIGVLLGGIGLGLTGVSDLMREFRERGDK